ncbi:hypothetical protein TNCV_2485211 [Trichonephila clavipes]|uniref:Uncharacterized protein n=1 Tax=Trichonephila clavipes TaxID=2585209 RepID=A0A8X6VZW5_TRICX|nr:hypothetical protein TNCV_2485211 [Trichonephila clavipes]
MWLSSGQVHGLVAGVLGVKPATAEDPCVEEAAARSICRGSNISQSAGIAEEVSVHFFEAEPGNNNSRREDDKPDEESGKANVRIWSVVVGLKKPALMKIS